MVLQARGGRPQRTQEAAGGKLRRLPNRLGGGLRHYVSSRRRIPAARTADHHKPRQRQASCNTHTSACMQAHGGQRQVRGRQGNFPCGRLYRAIRAREGGKHGALGGHLPAAKTTRAHTAHKARRAMARLGESNTPEHLAGEGNGGRQLAALPGRHVLSKHAASSRKQRGILDSAACSNHARKILVFRKSSC